MNILVTGAAGFIGYHLITELSKNKKNNIYGLDSLLLDENIIYKNKRLKILLKNKNFFFEKIDIKNLNKLEIFFKKKSINCVVNLAALAGVRKSIIKPNTSYHQQV